MSLLSRRQFLSGAAVGAIASAATTLRLHARNDRLRIGVTDWNLKHAAPKIIFLSVMSRVRRSSPPNHRSITSRLLPPAWIQHLMVVRIRPERMGPGDGLGAASGVGVGDGYYCDVLPPVKDEVVFVTVIPVAGVTDDGGAEFSPSSTQPLSRVSWKSSQRSQSD